MLTRRGLIGAGGMVAVSLARAETPVIEIRMRSDPDGEHIGFDPVGLLIQPGRRCDGSARPTTTQPRPTIPTTPSIRCAFRERRGLGNPMFCSRVNILT